MSHFHFVLHFLAIDKSFLHLLYLEHDFPAVEVDIRIVRVIIPLLLRLELPSLRAMRHGGLLARDVRDIRPCFIDSAFLLQEVWWWHYVIGVSWDPDLDFASQDEVERSLETVARQVDPMI
jgi:hypothetical protein